MAQPLFTECPLLTSILQQVFGFDQLRPGQSEVVNAVLQGHSAAAIFPTGSGKSLCYQLPALQLPHLTLVISPLLALIKDQLDFLASKGIAAASIDSSQSFEQGQQVMQGVRNGDIKILMISVERLKNERFRNFIAQVPISLMVVDEAHCISEWGHNFRPDYLKLSQYQQQLNIPQVLLLTATATRKVIADMQHKFAIAPDNVVITGFYRPNLDLNVIATEAPERMHVLSDMIADQPDLPTIVYVTQQQTAEQVAQQLAQQGVACRAYHAGMDSEIRQQIQADFMAGKYTCITATIAFGMGIDKADIRRVIHYDLPKSIENYSQEIGRAGRDGLSSQCSVLANKANLTVLENFVYGDTPDLAAITALLAEIDALNQGQGQGQWEIVLTRLASQLNVKQLPLKTLLVYLEMQGIIAPAYSYFAEYKFKYISPKEAIMARFDGERGEFIRALLAASPAARTWCTPDLDRLYQNYGGERKRAVAALDYLHEQGLIQLESKLMTEVYRITQWPQQQPDLAAKLHQLFLQKEQSEIDRIAELIGFFESSTCLSARLARYFADEAAPAECGHCSVCRGQVAQLPIDISNNNVNSEQLLTWLQPFRESFQQSLGYAPSAAAQGKFLCGIATPVLTKIKGKKMAGFAQLQNFPMAQVIAALEEL
ncbi:RecQ family ATP-dependent DNA helicase [Motilimonas pumila]|uniref:ATP-dependent DNA helicase RecQ n=2 Tax=Motilimonas pumila TaxID=2303987 RepID=A0A418YEM1_9GAMM|nr:RecQ family ATP-dependent DNA helicase [Motilimonas pumila]